MGSETIKLGVNVDHVATVRQARGTRYPDVLAAALAAERGGADGITAHLREDRRHIQDEDVIALIKNVATKLNMEMAATAEMVEIAARLRPADVCLVPERRQELTTEGGLNVIAHRDAVAFAIDRLTKAAIRVSLFIDPDPRQIEAAAELHAAAVEIHTGAYADAISADQREHELARIRASVEEAHSAGLIVNAGHGLTVDNVAPIAAMPQIYELNIGHSIVARALFLGIEAATREMKQEMIEARRRH